jgi:hypothetical protein
MAMGDVAKKLANRAKVYIEIDNLIQELQEHWSQLQIGSTRISNLRTAIAEDEGDHFPQALKDEIDQIEVFLNDKLNPVVE